MRESILGGLHLEMDLEEKSTAFTPPPLSTPLAAAGGGGSLLDQMRQRLQGGRFRWLNEELYTSDGQRALQMMQGEPQLMQQYHEGAVRGRGRGRCAGMAGGEGLRW